MVTTAEIDAAYRTVLGRAPESDAAMRHWLLVPTLSDLLEMFRKTEEYKDGQQRRIKLWGSNSTEKWLLLSNCNTYGLRNCINLLSPQVEIFGVDIWQYRNNPTLYNSSMADYTRVVLAPELMFVPGYEVSSARQVSILPGVYFEAYHPDICYMQANGVPVGGPMEAYHSLITFAAYNNGFTTSETLELFNAKIYESCRYFDIWAPAKERLIADFKPYNIDLRKVFNRWGARQPFMHSCNHPNIQVFYDIARLFLESHDIPVLNASLLPADNLVAGPCFPVYPELAEALGVDGSYLFKRSNVYQYITLDQFIQRSFEVYSQHPRGGLTVNGGYTSRYNLVESVVRGEA